MINDIHEGHLSQELILQKELETVFEFSYDPIYVIDGDGFVLRVNPACSRFYGFPQNHLVGKSLNQLEKQNLLSPLAAKKCLKTGMRISTTEITKTNREILITATPVLDEKNKVIRVVCNLRDLTELMNLKLKIEETERMKKEYETKLQEVTLVDKKDIVIRSAKFRRSFEIAKKVANVDSTILILGESGVGKNVLARFIHENSSRAKGPFIEINCGAISESLLESELFGYESGAFTGASKEGRKGHIEMADKGTIFLDEIGEMPKNLQVKLLHFLQNKMITRVGSSKQIKIDTRVISATNKDLNEMVKKGNFREDLYYRLNVVPIQIPALRERKEDITPLVMYFIQTYKKKYGIERTISSQALDKLIKYDWPGNVRELQNIIERVIVTSSDHTISIIDLPEYILENKGDSAMSEESTLQEFIEEVESEKILSAYEKYTSTYKAAKSLGMSQSTFARKLRQYKSNRL